jgi:hypothetical protein
MLCCWECNSLALSGKAGGTILDKLSPTKQTLGSKTHKKGYLVDILEGFVHWPLVSSVKKPNGQTFALDQLNC